LYFRKNFETMVKVKVNRVAVIFSDSLQEEVDIFLDLT